MRLLDLAPHCSFPLRDGADKRAWHLYAGLVADGVEARFIARKATVDGAGRPAAHSQGKGWRDRKLAVALAAVLTGRDYLQAKILTAGAAAATRDAADRSDTMLLNFLCAAPLLRAFAGRRVRLAVDTHNYDPAVFAGFRAAARNPLTRLLCSRSIRISRRVLAALPAGTLMVHVSEADAEAWRQDRPDLAHEVVENGCTVRPRTSAPDYAAAGKRRLIFVGSLSAQMNQDALRHFAATFWPALKGDAQFCAVGSGPPPGVRELCARHGWELRADVSEEELETAYAGAHFAVLPFAYGAGSKLKLMEACGRGVPVLATRAGLTGVPQPPPLVRADDQPEAWRAAVRSQVPQAEALAATLEFARQFSWPRLAQRLHSLLARAAEVTVPAGL